MRETLLVDGHVHIYPNFNLVRAITSSLKNFVTSQRTSNNRDDAVKFWLLTERSDCQFFQDLINVDLAGFYFEKTGDEEALVVKDSATKEPLLYLLAGRQIISSDNLEVCALATTFSQPDKSMNTMDTIHAVKVGGGLAAINWAPGKWFGERGAIVQKVFETWSPHDLFISDTTMRPTLWRTPKLMAAAQKKGFRVLCGSDPLPFDGEEDMIAKYAFLTSGDFDYEKPATFLKTVLSDPESQLIPCGRRSGPVTFFRRQMKIMAEKKK